MNTKDQPRDWAEIPLTRGKVTIVDSYLYEFLNQWKWFAVQSHGQFYARRQVVIKTNGKYRMLNCNLHHVILGRPLNGLMVDHINHNGLDNRKVNLRIVSQRVNALNSARFIGKRPMGASLHKRSGRWRAGMKINGRYKWLGYFPNKEAASEAYLNECKKLFPNDFEQILSARLGEGE